MNDDMHHPYYRLLFLVSILTLSWMFLFSYGKNELVAAGIFSRESTQNIPEITLPPFPAIHAEEFSLRMIGDPEPIFQIRGDKVIAPASITKILTASLAEEYLSANDVVPFSIEAKNVEEKTSGIKAGEYVERDSALSLALVMSANDATRAIAERVGEKIGGTTFVEKQEKFVALMNKKAHALHLWNTHFQNPVGLDDDAHHSSANDLSRLAEYIWYASPHVWEISRKIEDSFLSSSGKSHHITTTNELLKEYPAIQGVKTGTTDKSRESMIFLYPIRDGRVAVVVLLRSDDRFSDGRLVINWLEEYLP